MARAVGQDRQIDGGATANLGPAPMKKHSAWLQGVYLRLSTLDALPDGKPLGANGCSLFPMTNKADPVGTRNAMRSSKKSKPSGTSSDRTSHAKAWSPSGPTRSRSRISSRYQRFDADWMSFEDAPRRRQPPPI